MDSGIIYQNSSAPFVIQRLLLRGVVLHGRGCGTSASDISAELNDLKHLVF